MLKPLGDRIVVKPLDAEEKTSGGIVLPDSAKERPQTGEVIAVGPGKTLDNGTVCALTIAGSDSGGGAGIQADLKTFAAHRVHGLSAIAALTAQHTRGVTAVNVPPMDFLRAQLDACFDDFDIRAVKLGMLATAEVIGVVAAALQAHRPAAVIVDPVMVATSGAKLLEDSALQAMRSHLLPLAHVLTPNLPEAELLLGRTIADAAAMRRAAQDLLAVLDRLQPQDSGGFWAYDGQRLPW